MNTEECKLLQMFVNCLMACKRSQARLKFYYLTVTHRMFIARKNTDLEQSRNHSAGRYYASLLHRCYGRFLHTSPSPLSTSLDYSIIHLYDSPLTVYHISDKSTSITNYRLLSLNNLRNIIDRPQ